MLAREDDYAGAGKPVCDYDDAAARAELIDVLARDGSALLTVLDGRELPDAVSQAAALLATVLGQDLDQDQAGVFRIARRVAKDRVISTVDPETRHGHKTAARGFDGYKGHVGLDPDSEIITATTVTAGNVGDAGAAEHLISDLLDDSTDDFTEDAVAEDVGDPGVGDPGVGDTADRVSVYGDNAYGTGQLHDRLARAGIESKCKTQQPVAKGGLFTKDRFEVDLQRDTARCPAGHTAAIRRASNGAGAASFWPHCTHCPLRAQCTTAPDGRTISVGIHERHLADARARQRDPHWVADYRATRPKVERKIAHLMRRHHGGRQARVRGTTKIAADFALLAAAVNLKRLAVLHAASVPGSGWATATG
ncbi:MAG: transposase [Jatrophihabitans sp.]